MNGVTDQPVDPARAERIKQLNEDLKRVREHKAQLLAQQKVLQQLQAAGGSKLPPSKQKAGDKRPGEPHDRESKRARIEADRRKRLDAMFSTCSNIIKNIKRSTDATPFMKPVDPIALGIPDYFNIVKQPMDLGTISQRLENKARQPRQYQSPLEFLGDMRLVWDNCRLYNRPGDQVRVMGDKLSDQFERRWEQAGIERKFQEHVEKCTREDREMEGQTPLKDKINAYDTSLKRHFENTPTQPGDSTKPMQFEQKRRLSVALGSLSGEHLAGVLQIVASSVPDNNSEEVELDMDSLDDGVLWKLEAYVNSKLTSKGKPAKAASGVSGAGPGVAAGAAAPAANGLPLGMKVDEDGMKAEGDAGASVQQEQDQAQGNAAAAPSAGAANGVPGPEPAAGAGEGAVKDDKASNSSSSSSSGSGSSSSTGSDSEEVVSKDNVGSTLGDPHGDAGQQSAAGGGEGLEASALVSATRPLPHQPQILKQTTSKKEIAIENAGAWAAMAAEAEGQDEEAGAEDANADGGQQPEGEDALWSEFMSREQQQQKRQEEELKEEERRRAEKEKEEEERARHEEKAKGEEEREKQAQLASKEREERERRDQLRAKEVAELQSMGETNQHADMGFTMDVAGVAAGEGQNGEDYDMD